MRRLWSRHGFPITILLIFLILLLGLTPQAIYAFVNGQNASKVIGQTIFTTSTSATTQSGLFSPIGVAFDKSGNLWVADQSNDRVLEYSPPFSNGMNAALVIGQTSFTTRVTVTTQNGLIAPLGLAFDSSGNLWISDTGNVRVLEFKPPFSNGMNAALVIGQTSFTTNTAPFPPTQSSVVQPEGVAFDKSGNLWVADEAANRVLEYSPPFSNGMNAAHVIGEPDFTTVNFVTTQSGLNSPIGVMLDSSGNLWVADTFNNRVLEFSPPFSNGMNAALVIGQSSFTTSTGATTQSGLIEPAAVAFGPQGNLWVADFSNNRVLEFTCTAKLTCENGNLAALVIGQTGFTTSTSATTKSGMSGPEGVAFDSHGNLWVGEFSNNRVLEFPAKLPTSTKVTCTPNPVASGSATTCTATVTDTGGGTSVTPTGTVTWTSSLAGTFSSTSCTLSGGGSSTSCSVMFTPSLTGTATITAKYAGNSGLAGSKGTFTLTVT